MPARLLDRLAAARRRAFVGREHELARFRAALLPSAAGAAGAVLFVHGPGGIGKSALLRQFGWLAGAARRTVVWLDGRDLRGGPAAALAALQAALGAAAGGDPAGGDPLARLGGPSGGVLLVDNAELVDPMDGWLREELLPRLPAGAVVVLAGREPPPVAFRTDPGWRSVPRPLRLGNLSREHAAELLRLRGVPGGQHERAIAFTHGHPLALALLADVCAQATETQATEAQATGAHALPAAAATPQLLAALLGVPDARGLFDWLRDLSIMDYAPHGLVPHDVVRERLAAELRWRHPDAHAAIRARARAFYHRQLAGAGAAARRTLLFELAFLHRDSPGVGPFLRHLNPCAAAGTFTAGPVPAGEWPVLAGIIARHEGTESAELAGGWYRSQPASATALRSSDGSVAGLVVAPALDVATDEQRQADPAAAAAWCYLTQRRLPGDGALLVRHWMGAADHQAVSEVQTFIMLHLVRHYLSTPGLSHTFVTCADPQLWNGAFEYADFQRLTGADFEVGGRGYGMFGHDWRSVPPVDWIARMADRSPASGPAPAAGPSAGPGATAGPGGAELTAADFADAVRAALRDLTRIDRLRTATLGRSRLVAALLPDSATATDRARAVREAVRSGAAELESAPRDRKLYRVLHHTFLQPAETQSRAAELLDLPMSTYRRHLAAGVARLVEILWQRELDARG